LHRSLETTPAPVALFSTVVVMSARACGHHQRVELEPAI
jgi:hypothetical protein